jgi:UDP-glucose 4-epimerase
LAKNILVTGADGFIGSHLCEALIRNGYKVKALVAYNSFNSIGWLEDIDINLEKDLEIVAGDIRDSDFILSLTKNIDIIFHLAALISIPFSYISPRSYIDTNVTGTLNILQAGKYNNCEKIISTSTSEVYGTARTVPITEEHVLQAQSPYSASKIAADHLVESFVKSYSIPALILRPFNTYGPRQSERAVIPSIIRQIIDDSCKEIKVGDLSPKRDFNYIDDTVDAFISLINIEDNLINYGSAYNAGSGIAISIEETLKILIQISNCQKKIVKESSRIRPKNSEVKNLIASSKKLNRLNNWKPKILLNEGLGKTVEWWNERKIKNKIRKLSDYSF